MCVQYFNFIRAGFRCERYIEGRMWRVIKMCEASKSAVLLDGGEKSVQ